uniref:Uncharacterized protein n=1 Tax=Coccolithus braarudii TaxID=221442 RepID=A0A7S0L7N8_9EUKA|mmetsp:Transcript_25012/g.54029  ORF Transcript_25012/g.54029 Transcript_25012/m.54029 type:complete len:180 (+) Transcript_25012:2-541(+)
MGGGGAMYWPPTSESEREPSNRRLLPLSWKPPVEYHPPIMDDSPRNEKEKRRKEAGVIRERPRWIWWVGACLSIVALSTLGTTISVWRINRLDGVHEERRGAARVVHLILHGKSRKKTRFVVPEDVTWEEFMLGVQDRLQLSEVSRMAIHTSLGEEIMSIDDLVDGDNLIIHVDDAESR